MANQLADKLRASTESIARKFSFKGSTLMAGNRLLFQRTDSSTAPLDRLLRAGSFSAQRAGSTEPIAARVAVSSKIAHPTKLHKRSRSMPILVCQGAFTDVQRVYEETMQREGESAKDEQASNEEIFNVDAFDRSTAGILKRRWKSETVEQDRSLMKFSQHCMQADRLFGDIMGDIRHSESLAAAKRQQNATIRTRARYRSCRPTATPCTMDRAPGNL